MTVLLGVSMGTRAVRTAQPRAEQFGGTVADDSGLVTDIERPLFFRNELIDSVGGDLLSLSGAYGADPVVTARLGLERQWLHAHRLGFSHPDDGRRMLFESPYPADLQHALEVIAAD